MVNVTMGRAAVPVAGLALLTLSSGATACGDRSGQAPDPGPPPDVVLVTSPAPPNSAEPNLSTGPDGVYLTWMERTGDGVHALMFSVWNGESWTDPARVMERGGLFVNWADFPSMAALPDGTLAAHWLQRTGPAPYAYDVHVALSSDGGASWSEDVIPHRDGVETEHGFVSLFPFPGGFGAVWLDGREMPDGGPMTLRFTTIARDGGLGEEVLLDPMVCDCCQTGAAPVGEGVVVAYRGRTADQVRDILVTRFIDDAWTEPRTVHDDGWVIPGCPVNGPSIAADGDHVVVAWFTGASADAGPDATREEVRRMGEQGRVLAAVSTDGGASFARPVRIDDGQAMGRVGVVMLDDGEALVTWLERTEDGAEIRLRRMDADGGSGPSAVLASTAAARASGFPRVARFRDQVVLAWTESGDPPQVRTAVATVTGGAR